LDDVEGQDHVPILVLAEKKDVNENRGESEGEIVKGDHPDEGFGVIGKLLADPQELGQKLINV
jgi:hypothetical protein